MTLESFVTLGKKRIEESGIECADPMLHMKQILGVSIGLDSLNFYSRWSEPLTDAEIELANQFLERRLRGEPFQYLVGYEWFWHSRFNVGPGVLIPRKETEHLVEELLKLRGSESLKIGELGAGSGNIGISVLLERPQWEWHAFEINPESMPYLGRNLGELLPLDAKYFVHEGNFFELSKDFAPYDVIVSNPPYIAAPEMEKLSREVKSEPRLALVGGEEGTEILKHFIAASFQFLKPGGLFLTEIGSDQGPKIKEVLENSGFKSVEVLNDYSGLPRIAKGFK
ncbi:MAG: peptide chain release factor N(5)-glutamine methyltransferase [Proteobacteria bacterium]|nr:peptide chain release factor N(5)-glutamine methyltransferase [Pseudomonadota bacterium]NBY19075.1 peptide chain release factor N(5)-glutamine methyltransferase [bacterium]